MADWAKLLGEKQKAIRDELEKLRQKYGGRGAAGAFTESPLLNPGEVPEWYKGWGEAAARVGYEPPPQSRNLYQTLASRSPEYLKPSLTVVGTASQAVKNMLSATTEQVYEAADNPLTAAMFAVPGGGLVVPESEYLLGAGIGAAGNYARGVAPKVAKKSWETIVEMSKNELGGVRVPGKKTGLPGMGKETVILKGAKARAEAENIAHQKIADILASGKESYISPQLRIEVSGKDYLINTGGILREMGAESGDKGLNYWKPKTPQPIVPKAEAAQGVVPQAPVAPVQPAKAAGEGIVPPSAIDDIINNPRIKWKSEDVKAQVKAQLEDAITKGEATPESLKEELASLLGETPVAPAAPPAKPPRKPPTAKAGKTPKPEGEFAGNIRLSKYPEELRPAIKEWADANPEEVAKARRGVRSDAQVLQDAQSLVEDVGGDFARMQRKWKTGDAWNAEEILALRGTLRAKTESVLAAQKAVQESNSTENLVKLQLALGEQARVQEAVTGVTAESGRALRQFRQDVFEATKANDAARLERILKRFGGRDKVEETARLLSELDINDPAAINDFIRNLSKPGFWDYVTEIYYNSILSGPKTHIVNSLSNTANALVSPVERLAGAITEIPLSVVQRRARARFFNEVPADAIGAVNGLKDGLRAFANTYKYGISPEQASKFEMRNIRAVKGKLGRVINFPSTSLEAADSLMKSVNYRAAFEATAKRIIDRKGLSGQAAVEVLAKLKMNPTKALLDEANRVAETRLFRAEPGKFTTQIMGLREAVDIKGFKPLRYIIPFIRTPANLLKYGLERSPAGWLNPKLWQNVAAKNPEAADQIGRAALGSISAAAIAWYAHEGLITGAAPTNAAERDRFYRDGKQPFAIRIGNKWVSYQRLEPFNQTFALVAAALDALKNREKDALDKVGQAVSTIGQNMVSQTYLSGISDLINAISQPERYASNLITRFGTALLVPASSLTRTIAQSIDRTVRKPENFGDTLKASIPLLSRQVPERQTVFGEPVVRESPAWSPINITPSEETALTQELDRLGINIGFTGKSIAGVPLTTKEQADYQRLAGQQVKKNIEGLLSSSSYKSLSDASKEKAIQSAADRGKELARDIVLAGIPVDEREYRKKNGIPGKSLKAASLEAPAQEPAQVPVPAGGGGLSSGVKNPYR